MNGKTGFMLYVLGLWCSALSVTAQHRYEARILDQDDHQPVAYANVGIPATEAGTHSDSLGRFVLVIPEDAGNATLLISLIGYEEYRGSADKLSSGVVYLKKKVQALQEVVVKPAKLTTAVLGNDVTCSEDRHALPFPYIYESKRKEKISRIDTLTEVGTLMKVKKHRKTFIDSVKVNVGICTYDNILYRINVYEKVDGDLKNILREPIYLRRTKEEVGRQLSMDLTDRNLVVHNDFVVAIEWIKDLGPGQMKICGKLFGAAMYMRIPTIQQEFIKLPVAGMGIMAYVTFSENE